MAEAKKLAAGEGNAPHSRRHLFTADYGDSVCLVCGDWPGADQHSPTVQQSAPRDANAAGGASGEGSPAHGEQYGRGQAFETDREARYASRGLATGLVEELRARGLTRFSPAPAPNISPDWSWDQFADCRILVAWIPSWLPTSNAGKFVCRVDVIAS